jgi:LuxR family transcriptional regulator, maltose regulon positive regulatory protein
MSSRTSGSTVAADARPRALQRASRRRRPRDETAPATAAVPPPLTSGHVSRPRLVQRLLEADRELVLLSAPPGYGKTSLLAEWAQSDGRPFAWLTLGPGDDDGASLLARIAFALEQACGVDPSLGGDPVTARRGARAARLPQLLRSTRALLSGIPAGAQAPVLVLDDAHVLRSEGSLGLIKAFAVGLPSGGLLALASRTLPALPLGRMRASRTVLSLDAGELAMTPGEAAALLREAGFAGDSGALDRVVAITEGWAAGLSLAATSLRQRDDVSHAGARFDGRDRLVSQYVAEEVLAPCTPRAREFLVMTSVLRELSADACDRLLERRDSQRVLRAIAKRGLMLTPSDAAETVYRCHPLVRDVLRIELDRRERGLAARAHRRASEWFRERGNLEQASSHAVASGDPVLAGELLWPLCARYVTGSGRSTLRGWLGAFTAAQLAGTAPLALCVAHERLASGDLAAAEHWARSASAAIARAPSGEIEQSLIAGVRIVDAAAARRGLERMAHDASQACELVDDADPWRAFGTLLGGVARHLLGDRLAAREALEEAARRSRPALPLVQSLALAQLAVIASEENDRELARDLAAAATRPVEPPALVALPSAGLAFAVSAWVCAQAGCAAEARRDAGRAAQILDANAENMPWCEVQARICLARAAVRLADVALARRLLSQASRIARRMPGTPAFTGAIDAIWSQIDELGCAALNGARALTMAELRILRFLPTHLSFREIGTRLNVSTNTVKSQAHAIYAKLGVVSRSDAVARASQIGLIDVDIV